MLYYFENIATEASPSLKNGGVSALPVLTARGRLQANTTDLDVGNNACVVVVDWNNDKKKDLVIGTEGYGVRVYLNEGTNESPVFNTYTVPIMNYSSLMRCSPEVYDFDRDGKKDLVVGEEFGFVYFYKNIGTDASPSFSSTGQKLVLENGADLWVPARAHIDLVDWDEDGIIDLIIGDNNGTIHFFKGILTGVEEYTDLSEQPRIFKLHPNYPNPFNADTVIRYTIPRTSRVQIEIYNLLGKRIKSLLDENKGPGSHEVRWNGRTDNEGYTSSGIFLVVMKAGDFISRQKITMIK
ncbi:T9SS type A sorting domain-containing protein [bacterium]